MPLESIGFVGTGAITEALVRGLLAEPAYTSSVHLSPRSADIAARLSDDFAAVSIAPHNQAVIDRSDVVFLAIRPQVAADVIKPLLFKDGQSVISIIAATERESLIDWIGTDVRLVQAIPLPFVADRQGVTALFPPDNEVAGLFDMLGTAVQCATRKEYDLLAAASALMSTFFGVMEFATDWLDKNGLERSKGQAYLGPLFESLAKRAHGPDIGSFLELSTEFATKGGLNAQVLFDFETNGGRTALTRALDRVLARIEGRS